MTMVKQQHCLRRRWCFAVRHQQSTVVVAAATGSVNDNDDNNDNTARGGRRGTASAPAHRALQESATNIDATATATATNMTTDVVAWDCAVVLQ